ncbi:coiled-coil domain-containing protein 148 isoform X3 [Strigops habroptila]|uniref:Coiled-coil domain containing 148 n=1 Tax=Strigops habroptila TaxID=2489341 RepID=A0A672UGX6_STRHB|nr:coiled-coil domain-containing protein 148 isoform X3 [Strigops habroptila]
MSEPDHGTFFTTRRMSDVENLVIPIRDGPFSSKYKPVDYKHLYELAAVEKMASEKIQLKIEKTEQISKNNKERMLLKQHWQVWWQEHKRLSENSQKAEAEIKSFLDEESHKYNFFLHMKDLEHKLSEERDTYQTNTIAPIWQLKENLKLWLIEMQCYVSEESCLKSKINPVEMLQQIKFVKKQQKAILEFLILESLALEREIEDYKTKHFSSQALAHSFEEKNGLFLEVPSALLSLECPCPDLKTFLINEYRKLASGYWSKLQEIDQQLEVLCRNTEWNEEDQWVFQTVINQYASDLHKRTKLCLDALQRYLPHKSRRDLVLQWKAQQEEAAKLEAAITARRKEEKDKKERLQKEQEMICRAQEKEQVKKYWAEKQLKWQKQEEKNLQHLEELRKLMAEQAVKDRERVKFRQALLEKRLLKKKELALQAVCEEEEKKKCLELLRQQVAVVAKLDPARVVADTVASKARMGIGTKEEFDIQKPLFQLHTYNEQQIISDPRLRVELALREAGLYKTLYAKEILPKIPPLKLPRRDMESTAFKM